MSDEKLIELLNENKMMQYFCEINLGLGQRIKDDDVVSCWRGVIGGYLSLPEVLLSLQVAQVEHWQDQLTDREVNLADATCYDVIVCRFF